MISDQGKAKRKKLPSWLFPVVSYGISAASLIWIFRDFNVKQTLRDFASLDWRFVTIAVILDLLVYVAHGWRWKLLLSPVAPLKLWRTVQAVYIGLYVNEILPLRTGEIIRAYLLAHWNKLPTSTVISSLAIERVLDGMWLAVGFWLTTLFLRLPGYLVDGATILGAAVIVLIGVVLLIAHHKHVAHAVVSESRWSAMLRHVIEGIHAMGSTRTLLATTGASFVYNALQLIPVWALMHAYGLDLSFWAASAVYIILRLGTAIPNAPGNAGLYQFFVVLGLSLFGVSRTTAVGFSLMMFGVLTLPLLIGGFIAVALTGLRLEDLRRKAQVSMERRMEVPSE